MTLSEYNQEISGLPSGALARVSGNVAAAARRAADGQGSPDSLGGRHQGLRALDHPHFQRAQPGLEGRHQRPPADARLQLPLAAGSTAPALASGGPGSFGIRDPAQIASFVESAVGAVNPTGYAGFQAALGALRNGFGIDATGALAQLTGDLITAGEGQISLIRAGVSNPASVSRTLANVQKHIHSLSPSVGMRPAGGGFYEVTSPSLTFAVGLVGNQLVAGNASIAKLHAFAIKPTTPSGGHGAIAFSESLPQVLKLTGGLVHSAQAQLILSQLNHFSGWLANTTSALTGNALVTIK